MRELNYNARQVWTKEIVHTIVKVHAIVEKIAGMNAPLANLANSSRNSSRLKNRRREWTFRGYYWLLAPKFWEVMGTYEWWVLLQNQCCFEWCGQSQVVGTLNPYLLFLKKNKTFSTLRWWGCPSHFRKEAIWWHLRVFVTTVGLFLLYIFLRF